MMEVQNTIKYKSYTHLAARTCVDTQDWCRYVSCSIEEAAKICPKTCDKCAGAVYK